MYTSIIIYIVTHFPSSLVDVGSVVLPGPLAPQSEESARWGPAGMAAGRAAAWEDQDLDMWWWWWWWWWWCWWWWRRRRWWWWGRVAVDMILRHHALSMILLFLWSIACTGKTSVHNEVKQNATFNQDIRITPSPNLYEPTPASRESQESPLQFFVCGPFLWLKRLTDSDWMVPRISWPKCWDPRPDNYAFCGSGKFAL